MLELFIIFVLFAVAVSLLAVIVVGIFYALDLFMEVPYVATKKNQKKIIIDFAQIKKDDIVVDLGSGDGRLLIEAAKKGANGIGYEISPFMILLSALKIKLKGLQEKINIKKENLWKADLKTADVVFVYAMRNSMKKFEDFVWQNAKKGTKIIVNTNSFPNKKPSLSKDGIFLYIV